MSIFTRYNHKWAATKNLDSLKDQTTVKESLVRELKAERLGFEEMGSFETQEPNKRNKTVPMKMTS